MAETYYDRLAPYYKFMYPDWDASIQRQAPVLDSIIREYFGESARSILDAACGIGTQSIGLAHLGYAVTASDISSVEVEMARTEASKRGAKIEFAVADMRQLWQAHQKQFDVVMACDNAVPHLLSDSEIRQAFEQFYRCTTPEGGCIMTVRDYAAMERGGKRLYPRTIHDSADGRLVLFDLWEFDGDYYDMTTYVVEDNNQPTVPARVIPGGRYYCVTISTLERLLAEAGFQEVATLRNRFFQPLLIALKKSIPRSSGQYAQNRQERTTMARAPDSQSPTPEQVAQHYASGYEAERLVSRTGRLDGERSRELLKRFLPPPPARILDVGGGPGGHALWLAQRGYEVHLIDITPLHVHLAQEASARQPDAPLASASVGDACALSQEDEMADGVLLFGPLYHLTDERDRLQALREARRVLKPDGRLLAVAISRFASALDGLRLGLLKDSQFADIVEQDIKDGQHRNPRNHPDYFTDTFFHHPNELRLEIAQAGFTVQGVYGVEGPGWLVHNLDEWWNDDLYRERLLHLARVLEAEPALLGVSAHLLAVANK